MKPKFKLTKIALAINATLLSSYLYSAQPTMVPLRGRWSGALRNGERGSATTNRFKECG